MKTKIIIIAVLCVALAACGNHSRKEQNQSTQESETSPQELAMAEIGEIGDTKTPQDDSREKVSGAEPYVTHKHYSQDDSYTNIFEDTYKGKTLKEVYDIIVRNECRFNYHLREKLPSGNTDYKSDERDENVEVAYRFKTRKHLSIELNYPGGVTTVEIAESPGKTVSKITYSAD